MMKAGSMEGLIGASVNMESADTSLRVYKEAERRGDTAAMERAMGYVTHFQGKADEYSDKAQEELVKEKQAERREEAEEYREKLQEGNKSELQGEVNVEFSEEGKAALKNDAKEKGEVPILANTDVKMYTSEGKPVSM